MLTSRAGTIVKIAWIYCAPVVLIIVELLRQGNLHGNLTTQNLVKAHHFHVRLSLRFFVRFSSAKQKKI